MAAFIAFVAILFAPVVGVEPGFIDDEASRLVLEPKWMVGLAMVPGWLAEAGYLWRWSRSRGEGVGAMARMAVGTYAGTALVAVAARAVLGSPLLNHVIVSRGNRMTAAGWSILGATAAWILLGGTLVGALMVRKLLNRSLNHGSSIATIAGETAVSLAGVLAVLLALHRVR